MRLGQSLKEACEREKERAKYREKEDTHRMERRDRRDTWERDHRRYPSPGRVGGRNTSSDDPKMVNSRVFIGNLPTDKTERGEIESMFGVHGRIMGISLLRGFGFVQFEREEDAKRAVIAETGSLFKGHRLDIKMAAEGKRPGGGRTERRSPPPDRRGGSYGRDRSPLRDPYSRDSYGSDRRDPYGDHERRGPRDPYARDPYSRDPYAGASAAAPGAAYRDPYAAAMPIDCELIVGGKQLRAYAEAIEKRLKSCNLMTDINYLVDESQVAAATELASRNKDLLYSIVINPQNEIHRSLTVNIQHGSPQEHRNMPLDDALSLVRRNFTAYLQQLREKVPGAGAPAPSADNVPSAFEPPSEDILYLLNLLADSRILTVEELDRVIAYLKKRREHASNSGQGLKGDQAKHLQSEEKAITDQQQELQSKIFNILNGNEMQQGGAHVPTSHAASGYGRPQPGNTSINFDNPSVQKALDNLMSSGPSLLHSINPTQDVSSHMPGERGGMGDHPGGSYPPHGPGRMGHPQGYPRY